MCSAKRAIWLWLLVIFVGIQFGAGWYEKLGIVPLWAICHLTKCSRRWKIPA